MVKVLNCLKSDAIKVVICVSFITVKNGKMPDANMLLKATQITGI